MTDTNDTKMRIWDALKKPPGEALKEIKAGRQKGKSNINAQWRMEAMTREFGPCGVGWRYTIKKLWTEAVGSKGEVAAFAEVDLFFRHTSDSVEIWSEPIPGIGGNKLVSSESAGPYVNDECYKMAVTDALSVAFKALGVAAEVYLGMFDDKYGKRGGGAGGGGGQRQKRQPKDEGLGKCKKCGKFLRKVVLKDGSGRWFLGCQGFPDCKYTTWPDKKGEAKPAPKAAPPAQRPAPAAPAAPEATVADLPKHGAVEEAEEMCHTCGNHPRNPDGYCPNEHRDGDEPESAKPQQEWRPQCCDRTMMPRAGLDGGPPFWQCPRCKKKKDMSEEERKRVGL